MPQSVSPADPPEFAHAHEKPTSPWKLTFRIVRWSTYAFAVVTLILLLHKAPQPPVETSPQAAARAEQKFADVERAVATGQPATLRMDQTRLNSYLACHLELPDNAAANPAPTGARPGTPSAPAP